MEAKEIRMRCIEAISGGGIREPARLIRDAKELAEWVGQDEGQGDTPPKSGRQQRADKA